VEPSWTSEVGLVKYDGRVGKAYGLSDVVVKERVVRLFIDGEHVATFMSTPSMLSELAMGFLLSEGVIRGLSDVKDVKVEGLDVHVGLSEEAKLRAKLRGREAIVSSACGGYSRGFKVTLIDPLTVKPIASQLKVDASVVVEAASQLNKLSKVHRQTGGTHAAALFNSDAQPLAVAEDVSRHSAFDKAVGAALTSQARLDQSLIACTGRLTFELVLKSIRCGIPIALSKSAPTDLSIEAAVNNNLTLIGFARGRRFNVYSHPWRILM